MTCPSKQELFEYLVGRLPEDSLETVANHLVACVACKTVMATLDEAADTLVARLRRPLGKDSLGSDRHCQEAIARAASLVGGDCQPGEVVAGGSSGHGPSPQPEPVDRGRKPTADLGRLGEYELLEKLGEGGMGAVYKARHTKLKRIVAIKVLAPGRTHDDKAIARFEREMEAVGRVDHPNIVRAMDAREIEGTRILVMEYVEGLDLGKLVDRLGKLGVPDACELIRQAALGLQAAYQHDLVHRDIKPSNLILTREGQVKILDLGLALFHEDEPVGKEMTGTGQAMGTADYIAPEQATDSHRVDIRADIYSLGCTLYKLLTGHAPFSGPAYKGAMEKMVAHVTASIPPVRQFCLDVPEALAQVMDRMLAKAPSQRFATPAEVAEAMVMFTTTCDLAQLIAEATGHPEVQPTSDAPRPSTMELASSAVSDTGQPSVLSQEGAPEKRDSLADTNQAGSLLPQTASRRRRPIAIAVALAAAALFVALGIVIVIRNKEGKERRIALDDGDVVRIEQGSPNGQPAASGEGQARRSQQPAAASPKAAIEFKFAPEPLDLPAGVPMSKMALVQQPAPIPSVRSWTIETIWHRGAWAQAAYSPDGRVLATSCTDETIRLWDATTGRFLRAIVAHDDSILGFGWSLDGKLLATASRDGTVRFWVPETGLRLATLRAERGLISFAWSPDRRLIAAGLAGSGVQLWEFSTADPRQPPTRRGSWRRVAPGVSTTVCPVGYGVGNLSWCCDNRMLICGCTQGSVGLFDIETRQWRDFPVAGGLGLTGAAVSPDGKTAAFPGSPVALWNLETSQLVREFPKNVVTNSRMAWSPDGKVLAGGHWDWEPSAVLWDAESGKEISRSVTTDAGAPTSLTFSPDGETVAAGMGEVGRVQVFQRASGLCLFVLLAHRGPWGGLSWSPDAKALLGVNTNPVACPVALLPAQVLESQSGRVRHESAPGGWLVGTFQWSPDPDLVEVGWNGGVEIWRLMSGKQCRLASPTNERFATVAWSSDGKSLLTGAESGKGEMWDVSRPDPKFVRALPGRVAAASFSPDDKALAVASGQEVKICAPHTGEVRQILPPAEAPLSVLAWSRDGKTLAVAGENKKVHVFDVEAKRILFTCEGHTAAVVALGWSDGSKTLLSGSVNEVRVWDAKSGKLLRTISDDGGAISSDGRLVASRGQSAIRIRQTENGQLLHTIVSLRDKQHAAISPDGHFQGSPHVEDEFVYVVQTDQGQETLTTAEFSKRYGWKNDPSKALRALEAAGGGQ